MARMVRQQDLHHEGPGRGPKDIRDTVEGVRFRNPFAPDVAVQAL